MDNVKPTDSCFKKYMLDGYLDIESAVNDGLVLKIDLAEEGDDKSVECVFMKSDNPDTLIEIFINEDED